MSAKEGRRRAPFGDRSDVSPRRWPGLAAAAIAGVVDVLYLVIIAQQDTEPLTDSRVVLVATLVLSAGVAAATGSLSHRPLLRLNLLSLATSLLLVLGLIGIFSIGLPLLVAAGFSLAGALAVHPVVNRPRLVLGLWAYNLVVAFGVVGVGLALT